MFLVVEAMFLAIGGYILVREAMKLVNVGYIIAFDGYILVREAKKLTIGAIKHRTEAIKHRIDGYLITT